MFHNIRLKRLATDKNTSLVGAFVSYEVKKCCEYGPWTLTDSYKYSSLFSISVNDDKKFYNIDTWDKCYKTVLSVIYAFSL